MACGWNIFIILLSKKGKPCCPFMYSRLHHMRAVSEATVPVHRPRVSPRRLLDVEAALHWAYSKQRLDLVEATPVGMYEQEAKVSGTKWNGFAKCGCYRLEQIAQLGVRVDGHGPTIAEANPDAIDLHQSVMALSGALVRRGQGTIETHYRLYATRNVHPGGRSPIASVLRSLGGSCRGHDGIERRHVQGDGCRQRITVYQSLGGYSHQGRSNHG